MNDMKIEKQLKRESQISMNKSITQSIALEHIGEINMPTEKNPNHLQKEIDELR